MLKLAKVFLKCDRTVSRKEDSLTVYALHNGLHVKCHDVTSIFVIIICVAMQYISLASFQHCVGRYIYPCLVHSLGGTLLAGILADNPLGCGVGGNNIAHVNVKRETDKLPFALTHQHLHIHILRSHLALHDKACRIIWSTSPILIAIVILMPVIIVAARLGVGRIYNLEIIYRQLAATSYSKIAVEIIGISP